MSNGIVSSITRSGAYEPFELQVARGQIFGHSALTVFGYNPNYGTTEETVWPDGGIMPLPATATIMSVSSSSTSDTSAGTGAQSVTIYGLDANYNPISETVLLNGQTGVSTVNAYLRINLLQVVSVGSSGSNSGLIYVGTGTITTGVPATIYNLIDIGYNQSTTAHYTIPAGYTGYLFQGELTAGQASVTQSTTGRLTLRGTNGIRYTTAISTVNNGRVSYAFDIPIAISEKTDFEASVVSTATGNMASAYFNLVLVQNTVLTTQWGN